VIVYQILAGLTLVSHLVILIYLISLMFPLKALHSWVRSNALWLGLFISLTATGGSLYFSEILGWEPCKLCWLQRVFMYPLPFIFTAAILAKDRRVWIYALPLAIHGSIIAGYHYYTQRFPTETACSATGVSCAAMSFEYGYISIPLMAFTAFAAVIILMILYRLKR
jgi:hypothetical protein